MDKPIGTRSEKVRSLTWHWTGLAFGLFLVIGFIAYIVLGKSSVPSEIQLYPAQAQSDGNSTGSSTSSGGSGTYAQPQIISPANNSRIQGVIPLIAKSSLFTSLQSVNLYFKPSYVTSHYYRQYQVSQYRKPEDPDTIIIPFDSLAIGNGNAPVEVWICPSGGTSTQCTPHVYYSIVNEVNVVEPVYGATVSGSAVKLAATISGTVSYVFYNLYYSSGTTTTTVWSGTSATRDSNNHWTTVLDTTKIPNGSYGLRVSYMPSWQTYEYGVSHLTVAVSNIIIENAPTSTVNSNTNSTVNRNTNSNPTTNTDAYDGTNTAPPPALEQIPAPLVSWPKKDNPVYDLTEIKGSVTRGQQVNLALKFNSALNGSDCSYNSGDVAARTTVVVTPEKTFSSIPSTALKPGSYTLAATVVDNGRFSPATIVCFRVLTPTLTMNTPTGLTLTGSAHFYLTVRGRVSVVQFFAFRPGLPEISMGTAQQVSGKTNFWTMVFDTNNYPEGKYEVEGRAVGLDGLTVRSQRISVTLSHTKTATAVPVTINPVVTPSEPVDTVAHIVDADAKVSPEEQLVDAQTDKTPTRQSDVQDPKTTGQPVSDKLNVREVKTIPAPVATAAPALQLSGLGPPNSVVTIFIFSDPIVVTTRTDENGNWSYSLDRTLADGRHEVYVTVTDDTGKITATSEPFRFFVSEARAVSETEFQANQADLTSRSTTYLNYYLMIAGLLVVIVVVIFVLVRMHRHHFTAAP